MTTFNLGATTLNTGSYFGSGYSSVGTYGTSGNRVASSTNLQRVSRDIAQGYNSDLEVINLYLQQGDTDKALALNSNNQQALELNKAIQQQNIANSLEKAIINPASNISS